MANYRMNKNKQASGDNEVHKEDCTYYNGLTNYINLGEHYGCVSAVAKAKSLGYPNADGCETCSITCHTS